jgi:hypothetical protein
VSGRRLSPSSSGAAQSSSASVSDLNRVAAVDNAAGFRREVTDAVDGDVAADFRFRFYDVGDDDASTFSR